MPIVISLEFEENLKFIRIFIRSTMSILVFGPVLMPGRGIVAQIQGINGFRNPTLNFKDLFQYKDYKYTKDYKCIWKIPSSWFIRDKS